MEKSPNLRTGIGMASNVLVLGIETSCDETGLALVAEGRRLIAAQLASSLKEHQRYGGVVPEIASRAHVELLTCELEALLASARVGPSEIDRIAVTVGPGLVGSLLVGVAAAKALGLAWGKRLVGVNHLHAHLYAALMEGSGFPIDAPMIGLIISGGHTALVRMEGIRRCTLLGQTRDDAVGEAFDKVAKLLGLDFPGGPEIERVAKEGNPKVFRFSVPKMKSGSPYEFSLSGMKTAVLYKVREWQKGDSLSFTFVADMAASFQASIVEEVVQKTITACRQTRISRLVVGGGVVANQRLRDRLAQACTDFKIDLAIPSTELCTDNGAMVAGLGAHLETWLPRELTAVPDLGVEGKGRE